MIADRWTTTDRAGIFNRIGDMLGKIFQPKVYVGRHWVRFTGEQFSLSSSMAATIFVMLGDPISGGGEASALQGQTSRRRGEAAGDVSL